MIPTADLRVIPSSKVTENFQYQLIRVTDTEFAGKRGIRVGKGKGTWSGIPDISDDKKKVSAVAQSQKNELTASESVVVSGTSSANHGQNTNKEILTFVGQYSDQKEVFTDPEEEKYEYDITPFAYILE